MWRRPSWRQVSVRPASLSEYASKSSPNATRMPGWGGTYPAAHHRARDVQANPAGAASVAAAGRLGSTFALMAVTVPPPPPSTNPVRRLTGDLMRERRILGRESYPPGATHVSLTRTRRFNHDPLPLLLESYRGFGPGFTLRIFHGRTTFLIGPEANHFVTVSGAEHLTWRDGYMGDLMPLLGDGLLTTDGDFHRRARKIMLPAFSRERILASLDAMTPEIDRALARWTPGAQFDLHATTRRLALRIAMRALFGLNPDGELATRTDAATEFEHALGYYARDYFLQVLRGPGTPWNRMQEARERLDALIFGEISERRGSGARGEDLLSLLLDATDEAGGRLSDRHAVTR